jgi:glutaconate CoA-transferase, subunit B
VSGAAPATTGETQTIVAARSLIGKRSCFIGVGRPEIATGCQEVVVIAPHTRRTFVERLDFLTTTGSRTTLVITDLGVLEPQDGELTLTTLQPGATVDQVREATSWPLRVAGELASTPPPTDEELGALRELIGRG